ncbi:MAG: serine/threonine-protein kinase [Thermomicrobiales bacterium]
MAPGFHVVGHLHRGDRLDVYDVWSVERACRVIGKTLRPDSSGNAVRQALLQEGRLLRRLTHPHIVRAYEVHTHPQPLVILEALPGETLGRLIERGGPMPLEHLAFLGLHLCSALTYLHGQEILHLDLTPGNIIISHGLARLIDLSLAQPPGVTGGGSGTPGYRAREQAAGGKLTKATDIAGLGAVLVFASLGQAPTDNTSGAMPESGKRLAPSLRLVLEACLTPQPDDRPALDDVAACLLEFLPA